MVNVTKLSLGDFVWRGTWKKHAGTLLSCEKCSQLFYEKYHLNQHMLTHNNVQLLCHCGQRYKSTSALKRHMSSAHEKKFKFTCEICGMGFAYMGPFSEHVNRHHNIRPYSCKQCNAAFTRERELMFHSSICGKEKTLECQQCCKKFKHKRYLNQHLRTHSSPNCSYQCSSCGNKYMHKSSLVKHEKNKHWIFCVLFLYSKFCFCSVTYWIIGCNNRKWK